MSQPAGKSTDTPHLRDARPIAVFDSGLGGLSVVRQLRCLLPTEPIVYFGDTARVPYGIKSSHTVINFALEDARFLLQFDPKLMVVACNTASALALEAVREAMPIPVIGVVEPVAADAVAHAAGRAIAVIGTEATVASDAYGRAIRRRVPETHVISRACPLFVPLVEEGRGCENPLVQLAVREYLTPLLDENIDTLILGCTHYPLLRSAICAFLGPSVEVFASGAATARAVRAELESRDALSHQNTPGTLQCFVSDNPPRFQEIGSRFLEHAIEHITHVEPESYINAPSIVADEY